MGFRTSANRIRVTDGSGNTRLDTNDGLFHIVGSTISGSKSYTAQSTQTNRINSQTTEVIGSCNSACTHLIGAVKFTGDTGVNAIGYDRWTTYLGGTLVWALTGPNLLPPPPGGIYHHDISLACLYRFSISGTDVILHKHLVMEATRAASATLVAHQLQWHLKAGLFT